MTKTDEFWMVVNPDRSSPTRRHGSRREAEDEAERLAKANPGEYFYILHADTAFVIASPVTKIKLDEYPF